ncbi:MAG: arginine decarboxylase, pyruvoyl-dependent [Planctomycetes bacterium]|nr:arginine decarboxylase, pyruvoyl-dependent [Planctomycetota bacterium]
MNSFVPTKVFLTKGVGQDKYQLKSFEQALRHAGVAHQNLVQVSSIVPPKCKVISCASGLEKLIPGQISYCVMARADTNEHGRLVASSIGVAIPKDRENWGYLSEVHGHGMNNHQAGDMAEDLAAGMLGTTLGMEFDPDKAWSEKEQAYKASGLFIRTTNITQTARGKEGLWTTTVAIAMFLSD